MRTNAGKLATAATIILAAILTITVSNWMTQPAWALDQTIAALRSVKGIYVAGRVRNPGRNIDADIEIWARPSSDNPAISGDFRLREGDYHLSIASERQNLTYVYEQYQKPKVDVVYITEGLNRRTATFRSDEFLDYFQKAAEDWQEDYHKDPQTGRPSVYIRFAGPAINTARYWLIQIDLETKLPVYSAVWFDEDRQGKPHYEYTDIQYDPELPEAFFDFPIPGGTQVVDSRPLRRRLQDTPGLGIAVDGLPYEQACKKVVQAYWQAVINGDWDSARNLRPLGTGPAGSDLAALYTGNPPVELVAIPKLNHLSDPGAFTEIFCILKLEDGTVRHSLLNVDLQDASNGRIGVVAGSIGPEFYDPE